MMPTKPTLTAISADGMVCFSEPDAVCWGVTYLILSVLLNSAGDIMMANSTTRLAVDE